MLMWTDEANIAQPILADKHDLVFFFYFLIFVGHRLISKFLIHIEYDVLLFSGKLALK